MQGPTENAFELAVVGNAFLRGSDIAGFWPDAPTFRWIKTCEFRARPSSGEDSHDYPLVAAEPMAWFAALKPWCRGLRLHAMKRERGPNQKIDVSDRMLAAFVGGGPRWLIEAVGGGRAEIWEAFHRLGDRNDPQRRIWLVTYIRQGEVMPSESDPITLETALPAFKDVLPDIAAYARQEGYDNFADLFDRALAALRLHKLEPNDFLDGLHRYAGFSDEQLGVFAAIMSASVFGGMGSWNDVGGGERYEELSERLYNALNDVTAALANSTFCG